MWTEIREAFNARFQLALTALADALLVLISAWLSNFVYRFLPTQLPQLDRTLLEIAMFCSSSIMVAAAVAYGLKDLLKLLIRLKREIGHEWGVKDEE